MGKRAEELAEQVRQAADDLAAAVEATSPGAWRSICAAEGWSVGVVGHHAAGHLSPPAVAFVEAVANGHPVPPLTREQLDAMNAAHAVEHADCTKEETLALLRANAAAATDAVRRLSDEQLDRTAALATAGGMTVSTAQMIETVFVGTLRNHVASMRATA